MDIKKFATNLTLEDEGVWVQLDSETKLKIARSGNKRYRGALARLTAPHKVALRSGKVSDEVADAILVEALAEAVLLDWEGMFEGGKPLPYSKEEAKRLLADPSLKDFRDFVVEFANDMENYRVQELEESKANLKPSSAGK